MESKTTLGSWRKGEGKGWAVGVWSCHLGLLHTLSVAKEPRKPPWTLRGRGQAYQDGGC